MFRSNKPVDLSTRQIPLPKGLTPTQPQTSIPLPDARVPVKDQLGAQAGATGQNNQIGSTAVLLVPPRSRSGVDLTNLGAVDVWFGFDRFVTPTTGHLLLGVKGFSKFIAVQTPIWVVCATGSTGAVSWADIYDHTP